MTPEEKIKAALELIERYGGIEGSHHKQWLIDQILQKLTGDDYPEWVKRWENEPGYEGCEWEKGQAP